MTAETRAGLERRARRLQWGTIAWNSVEVFVTIGLGLLARSLALIAFGLDSLIEVFASLVVIWHLAPDASRDDEARADRDRRATALVALAFAILAVYLVVSGVRSLLAEAEPESSPLGIAYLGVTAAVMFTLSHFKRRVGRQLASTPLIAEASMTFLDGCLASTILTALALNTLLGWWWADAAAALLIGGAAAREAWTGWRER